MVTFNDGVAETTTPDGDTVDTDVLIVGSGPAGARRRSSSPPSAYPTS